MSIILIFLATFLITTAVNIQYRNAVGAHYVALFFTSTVIGSLNLFLLKTIPHVQTINEGIGYILGGACGAMFGVFLHKKMSKKKKRNKATISGESIDNPTST
jgi:uncharacterized membrane protein YfcA